MWFPPPAHYTPPAHVNPPYWKCCNVVGDPGETVCWACEVTTSPAGVAPILHTSTGSILPGEHELAEQLPEVDRLTTERTPA